MTNEQVAKDIQEKQECPKLSEEQNTSKRVKLRLIPIWLRVILVILLIVIFAVLGLVLGYAVIGEGNASDVLKWETWQHILDIINGVEE